jgi:class 3 adenylate cyclase/tetratricopeptide (TPR) repeat protein
LTCQNCGTQNRTGSSFCRNCGASLAVGCPACDTPFDPGDKFCANCGTALSAAAAPATAASAGHVAAFVAQQPAARPTPVAERRLVTVIFADLVGFTTLAEGRDPEETRDLLSRYFELARETIGRYGGTVEKFIGDAVMAVWGAPVATEYDAELAVRAALDLVANIHSLAPDLQARAGVLTGEAAVTLGAVGEGMVAGDLVNTASRLQAVAPPGSVLVGESTQRAAAQAITFERIGEQQLKGKETPVPAFRAVRVVAEVGGRGRSETLEAPFVGREEQLRLVKDMFHSTGREKRPRLMSVTGPAGIGKSRLAWEFLKYVDGLVETTWWHAGRSPAYGEGLTFWALGEMVRGRCDLVEADDEATTRAKVRETVERWLPDEQERHWVESALLVLLGIGEPPAGGRDELFAAWRTFFERMAGEETVVMLFEDLHWADPGLLDFIDHVVDWTRDLPLYIVTLARPELLEARPEWGAGKRNFISVSLEPLRPDEMRELLDGMVPGMPPKMAEAIVERADGIPLYAVETVRMLVARGQLVEEEGAYHPVGELTELAVPETLTALIAARLDSLDPAERSLLQDAAVLGQSFTVGALAAVSGVESAELGPRLRSMVKREVLRQEVHPLSPERGQYLFVQSLIREVAYNTLARPERRTRHLAAARYFEALGGDELAGALARHYLASYEYSPEGPERNALAVQARLALRGAAERLAELGSHPQAVTFLEDAIAIVTDSADEADLRVRTGRSATAAGDHVAAVVHLERAVELYRQLGEPALVAGALAALAGAHLSASSPSQAIQVLEAGLEELADSVADPPVIELRGQLARACMQLGEWSRALAVCDEVLAAAERAELVPVIADTLITRGSVLCTTNRSYEGLGTLRVGIHLAEERDLRGTVVRGRANLTGMLSLLDPVQVEHEGAAALALARRVGQRSLLLTVLANIALANYYTGDWQAAVALLEQEMAGDLDDADWVRASMNWFQIKLAQGEDVDAELDRLMNLLERRPERIAQTQVHDVRAFQWFSQGRLADARREALTSNDMEAFPEAILLAARASLWLRDLEATRADLAELDRQGVHGPMPNALRIVFQAGVAALDGRMAEALGLYREGRDRLRERRLRFMLALSGIDMATLLPGEPETAEAVAEAREILTELGARPFLERLEQAAAEAQGPAAAAVEA